MEGMAWPLFQTPLVASPISASSSSSSSSRCIPTINVYFQHRQHHHHPPVLFHFQRGRWSKRNGFVVLVGKEETTEMSVSSSVEQEQQQQRDDYEEPADRLDLEDVRQIKRVLELLQKNRDMLFSEVKLTVMIEDPREVERRRLLGIEDPDAPTRDDLAACLEEVNKGKVPKNRLALRLLAEEMIQWPNLEVEVSKTKTRKSLYAKTTDTGIDPKEAAKRLNIDWDSAAEIEDSDGGDDTEVPPAVGYGALYLVTAFPVIIGISVVLILFFNSLQ